MRKRSSYRPKGVRLDNMAWVTAGLKKVGNLPKAGVGLKIKNHLALDSIMHGDGTRESIDDLIACFNIAEALYRVNPRLGRDYAQEIKMAQDAVYSLGQRYIKTSRVVFTGMEMMAVRAAMDIHDAQLDDATVKEMEHAIDLVNNIIANKHARPIMEKA